MTRTWTRPIRTALAVTALLAALTIVACGGGDSSGGDGGGGNLTLVAYSTPEEAYKELIPAFKKTAAGKDVAFSQSYGASGDQSRKVEAGLPTDVVNFSLEPDVTRLVDAGLVDADWNRNEHKGIVPARSWSSWSARATRRTSRPGTTCSSGGIEVVEPNPFTSGGAKWNMLAAYGAKLEQGKAEPRPGDYLAKLFGDTSRCSRESGREATRHSPGHGRRAARLRERGDLRPAHGEDVDYVDARHDVHDREPGRGR